VIAGTLAYMARNKLQVEPLGGLPQRSYALGVTFYEMLTGQLPFTAADRWNGCTATSRTTGDAQRAGRGVPGPLSGYRDEAPRQDRRGALPDQPPVSRRSSKMPRRPGVYGRIDRFPLGEHDGSDRLLIREAYGREREIEALIGSIRQSCGQGTTELVLVTGYSGIGKSSVVHELHKALVPRAAFSPPGSSISTNATSPMRRWCRLFRGLVRPLLSKTTPS